MSLRLVCGRSGTGKSEFCLNEAIENLNNNQIYIITPEQFSYSAERKLMDKTKTGALIDAEVLTFKRMAYRVENEVGGSANDRLSKSGKAMLIYSILFDSKNNLKFLGKSEQNIEIVENALTEFKKHGVTLKNFKKALDSEEDRFLKEKMNDLYYIYEKFESRIKDRFIDENDILTTLSNNLDNTDMFKDSIIYIDEFVGFTYQEYKIIERLLKQASKVTITVNTDNLDMGTNRDSDVFYSNKQTADKLLYLARKNEIECEKTVFLDKIYGLKTKELQHLEENIYNVPYNAYQESVENIKLYLAQNAYSETEHVAKEIIKLIKEREYRYRDIAVITKDLDTYGGLVRAIFGSFDIPVFIDEKKVLSQNSFIKYVMSILDIFSRSLVI